MTQETSAPHPATKRQQLEESLVLFYRAVEQSPVSIAIMDVNGNIQYVNPRFTQMTGYTAEEAFGQNPRDLKSPESPLENHRDLWETITAGREWKGEFHNRRKNGEPFWESATISPILDEKGNIIHFLEINEDITERKRIESELIEAHRAVLESARLKSEFLANMSHEIRTPMNGVIGMTGLLLDTPLSSEQRDFTETIRASGEALLTIINDILDFSKIEAGKLHFETLDFNLRDTVEGVAELLARQAHLKKIELASIIENDMPILLRGDPGRLRQVLTNLVSNAIKFTERGEVIIRVRNKEETPTHALIRFEVMDTGIGVSEEDQKCLFQAFSQADGSTTRKYGGTGLGLAISKQLVERMEGQIGVTSQPGVGSTFWFTARMEKQSHVATVSPPIPSKDLSKLRVLIVDDNATNRKLLHYQLIAWGMRNENVASGPAALAFLRQRTAMKETWDIAILDMQMPEMDGLMLARAIKADPAIASIRLVMMTSLGNLEDMNAVRAAGISVHLTKPVKQSQLFDCLAEVGATIPVGPQAANVDPGMRRYTSFEAAPHDPRDTRKSERVLLAEDNAVNQKVALRQLEKLGYRADAVGNGREVLDALEHIAYDIVLMDCQMPEMDGYETTREIRRREQGTRAIIIIAMTAHAMESDRQKCLAAGMDDYIAKPVRTEELRLVLGRCLQLQRPNDECLG